MAITTQRQSFHFQGVDEMLSNNRKWATVSCTPEQSGKVRECQETTIIQQCPARKIKIMYLIESSMNNTLIMLLWCTSLPSSLIWNVHISPHLRVSQTWIYSFGRRSMVWTLAAILSWVEVLKGITTVFKKATVFLCWEAKKKSICTNEDFG